jgi:hypothetical protein
VVAGAKWFSFLNGQDAMLLCLPLSFGEDFFNTLIRSQEKRGNP